MSESEKIVWHPITQYVRPNGIKRATKAPIRKKYADMAKDMVISAEVLPSREVALYARFEDQPEEKERLEIMPNKKPDPNDPTLQPVIHLEELIEKVYRERHGK